MARKKISEFRAKTLLHEALEIPYHGVSVVGDGFDPDVLDATQKYVVKVDEGVKKRMKKGLVGLKRTPQEITEDIEKFRQEGYSHFIIEPFVPHEQSSEKYFSIERVREGLRILYSEKGGIDVEENGGEIKKITMFSHPGEAKTSIGSHIDDSIASLQNDTSIDKEVLEKLLETFNKYHFSFLEINPLVVENSKFYFLDIAAEVDSSAEFFVGGGWTADDFRSGNVKEKTVEEKEVDGLSQKSQASFNLTVLNPDGAVFMLLSGGGASIVLADEVYDLGLGKRIGNYGEYSGNPNAEEVHLYTKNLLRLLLKSKSQEKVLIIGGGVANFTNIGITFKGVIKALDEVKEDLQKQNVKVFVRRGGPHQAQGLAMMEKFLKENSLYGLVADQKTTLPEIVKLAVAEFSI